MRFVDDGKEIKLFVDNVEVGFCRYIVEVQYLKIDLISIRPIYRRNGYGTLLIDYLISTKYHLPIYLQEELVTKLGNKFFSVLAQTRPIEIIK